ncbi:response regulator transcription factor [Thermoflexus sp.]|uniref:response regulator transcription factor n=1 Tax=Thermoflexus sp. TaxID=1969742 RepID=UPI0035E441A8
MAETILVIEDDVELAELIRLFLERRGFQVVLAFNGTEGWQRFQEGQPDLVILDLMLPDIDGLEICRRIRGISTVPVLILTARTAVEERVEGLKRGADDYMVKPFAMEELLARIEAHLRRVGLPPPGKRVYWRFGQGALLIDPQYPRVILNGEERWLTETEHRLLCYLAERAGQTLTPEQIARDVWPDGSVDPQNIKWYIWRLRRRIEPDPEQPRFLLTERGFGYRFALG